MKECFCGKLAKYLVTYKDSNIYGSPTRRYRCKVCLNTELDDVLDYTVIKLEEEPQ